jgi:hypothetical protein
MTGRYCQLRKYSRSLGGKTTGVPSNINLEMPADSMLGGHD